MKRIWIVAGLLMGSSGLAGCATCCSPDLYNYPTFGGRYERVDRAYGRVGSVYSDPTVMPGTPAPLQSSEPADLEPDATERPSEELELPRPQPDSPAGTRRNQAHPTDNNARLGRSRWR